MKKLLALLLAVAMVLSLAACGGSKNDTADNSEPVIEENTSSETTEPTDATEPTEEGDEGGYEGYVSELVDGAYARGDDEEIYNSIYGEFCELMEQARNAESNDERFVLEAKAEAVLLDSAGRLTDTVLISRGSASATLFDLKTLLSVVIQHNAKAVALCHNHPRGTPRPSEEDVRCTLDALKALRALAVPMLDHIIVAYDQAVSLRETGAVSPDLWVMQAPKNRVVRDWLKEVQAGG